MILSGEPCLIQHVRNQDVYIVVGLFDVQFRGELHRCVGYRSTSKSVGVLYLRPHEEFGGFNVWGRRVVLDFSPMLDLSTVEEMKFTFDAVWRSVTPEALIRC